MLLHKGAIFVYPFGAFTRHFGLARGSAFTKLRLPFQRHL